MCRAAPHRFQLPYSTQPPSQRKAAAEEGVEPRTRYLVRHAVVGDAAFLALAMRQSERAHMPSKRGLWDVILGTTGEDGNHPEACLPVLQRLASMDRNDIPYSFRRFLVVAQVEFESASAAKAATAAAAATVSGVPVAALAGYDPAVHTFGVMFKAVTDMVADEAAKAGHGTGTSSSSNSSSDDPSSIAAYTPQRVAAGWERAGVVGPCLPPSPSRHWAIESVYVSQAHRRTGLCATLLKAVLAEGAAAGHDTAQIVSYVGNKGAEGAYTRLGFVEEKTRTSPEFEKVFGVPGFVCLRRSMKMK